MSEKQTNTPDTAPAEDARIISDEEYAMIKDWEESAASHRVVSLDGIMPTTESEAAPEGVELTDSEVTQARTTARPASTGPDATPSPLRLTKRGRRVRATALGLAGVGVVTAAVAGIAATSGGSDNSERGDLAPGIESVTTNPDARFRLDPTVPSEYDSPNVALSLPAELKIDAAHDIRVLEGTNNGTWYGFPVETVAKTVPAAADVNDKDGILWVNEQGVEAVQSDDSSEK